MATGRVPTTANSPLTAKGDLFGYSTTQARVPVGNDGETLVADSSTSTGLRYNPQNALANPIINGGFDIWQRGTSFTNGNSNTAFGPDRWQVFSTTSTGRTWTRQSVNDSTNLPNIQYSIRSARNSGDSQTNLIYLIHNVETVNSIPFAGRTVTLSFYARAGANFSSASNALAASVYTGTGTDQNSLTGYTGSTQPLSGTATLTTTWQRFAFTFAIPATSTEMAIQTGYIPSGTAGANDWFEITGIQFDLGTYTASSAPAFRRSGGTLAGEFALAQRYYQRYGGDNVFQYICSAAADTSSVILGTLNIPKMRTAPTVTSVGNWMFYANAGIRATTAQPTLDAASSTSVGIACGSFSGLTGGWAGNFRANADINAFIALSAEL